MGIRDRLRIYDKNSEDDSEKVSDSTGIDSLMEIGFEKVDFEGQCILRLRTSHPLKDLLHPRGSDLVDYDISHFFKYNGINESIPIEGLLFLYLETTSLSVGTGNYPFLIGLGCIKDESFVIDQFFMHNFGIEGTMLKFVLPYFHHADGIVTYNGKTFDIPLIKNRYRINRIQQFPLDSTSVDLLYSCRRIFKNLYEDCTLKTMEERVLGIIRQDDIPGWLIPEVFFSYQKYGETDRIPVVIEHNRRDVESMLMLFIVLNSIYTSIEKRDYESFHSGSLINIANCLYRIDMESFLDLIGYLGNEIFKERTLFKKYSTALKRAERLDEALALWESEKSIFSLEELAKHYEHRERALQRSLAYCDSAVELLIKGIFSFRGEGLERGAVDFYRGRFLKRIERLNRKLDRSEREGSR
jgi:uncharacterized protein YprB with RNaseH-like and TPR domain